MEGETQRREADSKVRGDSEGGGALEGVFQRGSVVGMGEMEPWRGLGIDLEWPVKLWELEWLIREVTVLIMGVLLQAEMANFHERCEVRLAMEGDYALGLILILDKTSLNSESNHLSIFIPSHVF